MTASVTAKGRVWLWALAICLLAGLGFYVWLLFARWSVLDRWGALGSALGPIAALFSAGAVFAALRSIELQRAALAGQREELSRQQAQIDRHMKLLEEQREQFARSAAAHEALSASQTRLAAEQEKANEISRERIELQKCANNLARNANRRAAALELAQRASNTASLLAARIAAWSLVGEPSRHADSAKKQIDTLIERETQAHEQLRLLIEKGQAE